MAECDAARGLPGLQLQPEARQPARHGHGRRHPCAELSELPVGSNVDVYAEVGGSRELLSSQTLDEPIGAGRYLSALKFSIDADDARGYDTLIVEITASEFECDVDNNALRIDGPFCGGVSTGRPT
ncbi:MAG: hypothetical protein ACI8S6_000150 [Myxococcota bacterium]|jgi:hypothetical protein